MTPEERQNALTNLGQILFDNGGNKMTLAMMNGVLVTYGQFLDTLLVADAKPQVENGAAKE